MIHKNRGMFLESIINRTIRIYLNNEVGLFHKKAIPMNFSGIKKSKTGKLEVNKGWIQSKSTTDYYGIYKGQFIAFEAKSTKLDHLPISNIREHQHEYLKKIKKYGGIGFYLIYFEKHESYFLVFIENLEIEKKKKITIEEIEEMGIEIELTYPGILDFVAYI